MFIVEQTYDLKATTALNVAMRKTVRRWYTYLRGGVWVLLAISVAALAVSIAFGTLDVRKDWKFLFSIVVIAAFLFFDDRLNGWISLRRLFPGTAHSVTVFGEEEYVVTTDTIETKYRYEDIVSLCERGDYYFFFLGSRYGEIFDKRCFTQGDAEAFRAFIEQKTGKHVQTIK